MTLKEAVEHYVGRKRSQGLAYCTTALYLHAFCKRSANVPLESVTAREILPFLDENDTSPATWMRKYYLLRAFFDFWLARGEIGKLPMPAKRRMEQKPLVPYIYTHSEIRNLLKATRKSQMLPKCVIDPFTFRTFLIFLYATGALVGEALRLSIRDVDLKNGFVTIRCNPHSRSRTIPICSDLVSVLKNYFVERRRQESTDRHVFLNTRGGALDLISIDRTFHRLRRSSGIRWRNDVCHQPRMHDLRHTFAVHRITGWIKHNANLNEMLPALSVYMGFVGLGITEKYLSLTPERLRAQLIELSPQCSKRRWRDDPKLMQFLSHLLEQR